MLFDKKLKRKIKKIIKSEIVDCIIRHSVAGNYQDYVFPGYRSYSIGEAKKWIWLDYYKKSAMNKQEAINERKQNLACLKSSDMFSCENQPAYLLYRLDKRDLVEKLGIGKGFVLLAEDLTEQLVKLYNDSFVSWRIVDIADAISLVNKRIEEVTDEEERQELVDNKEAVALALVLLCSYFDYSDLKIKKKVNR